jgi:spore coat protein H
MPSSRRRGSLRTRRITPWIPPLFALTGCLFEPDAPARDAQPVAAEEEARVARCSPTGQGTQWVREGDRVEVQVGCATGLGLSGQAFAVRGLPRGATYDPAHGVLRWQPALDQAASYRIDVEAVDLGEQGSLEIGVVDRWDDPNNVSVDPFAYTQEYGLPVLHLFTSPELNAEDHTAATVIYQGREYPGAQAKHRGATSLSYPKKSFTLKFESDDRLSAEEVGLNDERRIVLTSTFDDDSHLRQRLAYTLWNRTSGENIDIQAFNAVLFLDNQYHGIYVISDHVDDDLVADHGLWKDGNLYKARLHDANFALTTRNGNPKNELHQGYTKEEGTPAHGAPDAYADLDELIEWVATSSDEEFVKSFDQRLSRSDFEAWWIFVSLIQADDSAGKNSYLYHDPRPESETPLWRYVPWDFNASFGQDWRARHVGAGALPEDYQSRNRLFERMLANSELREPLLARYERLLQGNLQLDDVLELVDRWGSQLEHAASRDQQLWGAAIEAYRGGGGQPAAPEQEVAYLRAWISERWSFLGRHLSALR